MAKVEVAVPVFANAVLERIRPEASIAPDVVVACPTPKPPEVPPTEVAPMKAEPPIDKSCVGEVVPIPTNCDEAMSKEDVAVRVEPAES